MTPHVEDDLVQKFLEHMQLERTPKNTVAARLRTLRLVGTPGTATREEIEEWWRSRAGFKPSTRANDLANLRAFYKWAQIWEHRLDDPTIRLSQPKVPNGVPRPVHRDELNHLLETLPDDLRRAACLGAWAGLRVSEAAALHWSKVDREMSTLEILGKGQKNRIVAAAPILIDQLLPDTGGNVVTGTEKVYSADTLQRRVNRAITAAGIDKTFHQLRHRYGTIAYQATGDLVAVADQMGHASIITTRGYAQANTDVARKIAAAVVR